MGENIIIISILAKSRSVAPVKLEINLVSPKNRRGSYLQKFSNDQNFE